MSPGHHDEIYERNKLPLNIVQSNKYCKKPILQALSIFINFSQPFLLYSFLYFSCCVIEMPFSILQVG